MDYEGVNIETIRTNKKLFVKSTFESFLDKIRRNNEADILIAGHTHRFCVDENPIKNSGTFGYNSERISLGKYCIMSDVHIGAQDFSEEMQKNHLSRFQEIFESKENQTIVIIGDLLDLWLSDAKYITKDYKAYFDAMQKALKQGKRIIYIVGNHDADIYEYLPIINALKGIEIYQDHYIMTINDKKYVFIHGHQYDLTEETFIIRLFYYVWCKVGDNLYFFGNYLKKPVLWIQNKLKK